MAGYWTNDQEGKYFPDKYKIDLCTPKEKYICEYFPDLTSLLAYFEKICGQSVKSEQDIQAIVEQWEAENENAYCYINEYAISD